MDLIIAIIVTLISFPTFVYGYFKYSFGYWTSRGVPCDEPSIPYGHVKGVGKKIHNYEIIKRMYDKYKPTGAKVCGLYLFARPAAILLDLELVKHILIKDFNNFADRNVYSNEADDPVSAHLFSLEGDKWKKLRAKLTPAFSSCKMKYMFPTVVEVGERFRSCLLEAAMHMDSNELEIREWCARFTTDVIGTCAFGIECNSLKDPNAVFRQYGRKMAFNARHGPLFLALLNGFKSVGRALHVKTVLDDVSEFIMKMVSDTFEYREQNNLQRDDFMDILIQLKSNEDKEKALTFNEIAAQTFLFFAAGFETSSTAMTFCLYEMAVNPDIQTKARHLIEEAFKKYNGQFTYEMMMDLPYIDQILEETLRKYPGGPFVTRGTKNDYRVPGTDIVIEKGLDVIIPIHAIHFDPEYYPNPHKFDPDRFRSDEKSIRDPITWLPFGNGPRNCIGLRFAMMQTRVGIILLLRNFEFSLGSKTTVPLAISKKAGVFSPQDGVYLKVKPLSS